MFAVENIFIKNLGFSNELEIALIALAEKAEPSKLRLFKPLPPTQIAIAYPEISKDGDSPEIGRYIGYAAFNVDLDSAFIEINNLDVFDNGVWIAVVANDTSFQLELKLSFKRTGINEAPAVSVEPSNF